MVGHVYVKHGGAWVEPTNLYVKRSGAWVEPLEAYVKIAGVWQQFYPNVLLPFSPADLAALVAWYDGNEFTGQANGTVINTWTDQEGAFDAPGAANRPIVAAGALNGKAAVELDGAGKYFYVFDVTDSWSSGSAFFVAKLDSDPPPANTDGPVVGDFGTEGAGDHYPYSGDGGVYIGFGSTARKTVGNPATSLATWHISNFNSAAGAWSYYLNGTSVFSTATNTVAWQTHAYIGFSARSNASLDGKIAEVLLFNAVLGTSDRQKVEGYLAHRWGIASVLDAGHPYKASAP